MICSRPICLEWVGMGGTAHQPVFSARTRQCFSAILGPVSIGLLKRTGALPANPSDDSQPKEVLLPLCGHGIDWVLPSHQRWEESGPAELGWPAVSSSGFGFSKYLVKHTVKSFFSMSKHESHLNSLAALCWNECPKFSKSCNHHVRSYCVLPGILGFSQGVQWIPWNQAEIPAKRDEIHGNHGNHCWILLSQMSSVWQSSYSNYWTSWFFILLDIILLFP